jgi:outer membrane cobalamin receptor
MRQLLFAAMVLSVVPTVRAADNDNPWKNAKVGDWVEYKTTGMGFESKTKMIITVKDDKEVTYEITATFTANGVEMTAPVQKQTVDLTKDYSVIAAKNEKDKGLKIEKVDEGKEKLKIGDKEYDTTWTKTKATATFNGVTTVSEYKTWMCKDVPLNGMVRMDTTIGTFTSKLELTGSGRK